MKLILEAIEDGIRQFLSDIVLCVLKIIAVTFAASFIPGVKSTAKSLWHRLFRKKKLSDTELPANSEEPSSEACPVDAEECYRQGLRYEHGKGIRHDRKMAMKFYRQASDLGHIEGKFRLGKMYYASRDYVNAITLFLEASEGGNTEAMYELGRMYMSGKGTNRNRQAAYMLFTLMRLMGDSRESASRYLMELNIALTREEEETARNEAENMMNVLTQGKKDT